MIRRLAVLFTTLILAMVMIVPAASAWSVAECSFNGWNSFSGNTAKAYTGATNTGCDAVWGKVHYKVDAIWDWSMPCYTYIYDFCIKNVNGADDADLGKHRALSNSGGLSVWYVSY